MVSLQSWHAPVVAIAVLDVVNIPSVPQVNIFSLERQGPWVAIASLNTCIRGDTNQEALIMNIVRDLLESVGKLVIVGVQEANLVSCACLPAIVNNHILKSEVLQAAAN